MRIYQLKIDGIEEGEVIRWISNKADAEAAIADHEPFAGCAGTRGFECEIHLMDEPTTNAAMIEWLNINVRGKRIDE